MDDRGSSYTATQLWQPAPREASNAELSTVTKDATSQTCVEFGEQDKTVEAHGVQDEAPAPLLGNTSPFTSKEAFADSFREGIPAASDAPSRGLKLVDDFSAEQPHSQPRFSSAPLLHAQPHERSQTTMNTLDAPSSYGLTLEYEPYGRRASSAPSLLPSAIILPSTMNSHRLASDTLPSYFSPQQGMPTPSPKMEALARAGGNGPSSEMPSVHPLEHRWTFYQQLPRDVVETRRSGVAEPDQDAYERTLRPLGTVESVEAFARLFTPLSAPSKLEMGTSVYVFKDDIMPAWEDDANAEGGKWTLTIKSNPPLLDRSWLWLVLALVGEQLDDVSDEVCGAAFSIRPSGNRVQLWCRDKSDIVKLNVLGRQVLAILELPSTEPGLHFDFYPHSQVSSPSTVTSCFFIRNPARSKADKRLSIDASFGGLEARPRMSLSESVAGRHPSALLRGSSPLADPAGWWSHAEAGVRRAAVGDWLQAAGRP